MKRLSITSLLLIFLLPVFSQNVSFKIGGGLSSRTDGMRVVGAFRIGIAYEYRFDHTWSFEPSLLYSAKGWKNHDKEVFIYDEAGEVVMDEDGNPMKGVMGVTSNANYIQMPLLMHCTLNKVKLSLGTYMAYGIGGKTKTNGDTQAQGAARFYHEHSTFDETGMHRFDLGLSAGVSYLISDRFSAGLLLDYGFLKVISHGGRNQSFAIQFSYTL